MGSEQQAVEDVEALGVGLAGRPGLDVARAEEHPRAELLAPVPLEGAAVGVRQAVQRPRQFPMTFWSSAS